MFKYIILVIGMIMLLSGCKADLYSELQEQEVNEMLALLFRNNIDAEKIANKKDNWKLVVSRSEFAEAVRLLKESGYPKPKYVNMGDVFKREGLISSPSEERIRYIYALSQELANTISKVDGVISARVHIVLPNEDPFNNKANPSSASVFLKSIKTSNIQSNIPQIKQLVVNSIEGLAYDKVSVVLFQAEE